MQKLYYTLAVVAIMAVVAVFGVRQYGKARVAEAQYEAVENAVSEAVAGRKAALKTDVAQTKQSSAVRAAVRSVVLQARKEDAEIPAPCPDDAARLRVLNDAIGKVNSDVQRAGELPR